MGLFDYVDFECECPSYGRKVIGFQTKEGPMTLDHVSPYDINNFYSSCGECKLWIEFTWTPISEVTGPAKEGSIRKSVLTKTTRKLSYRCLSRDIK